MIALRAALAATGTLAAAALVPPPAGAHGLVGRADLPIPEWLFVWAAVVVLVVSFVALAALWPKPRLEDEGWRPLGGLGDALGRALTSRPAEIVFGAVGAALLAITVWTGFAGVQSATANFAPTFVYVIFWVGLVPASVLLGDVFRAFNPWRAIGRAFGWCSARLGASSEPLAYPERLGRWPAVAGIFGFVWLELVATSCDQPRTIAIAALAYSAAQFLGMALYGVETWMSRAEGFSVYFNLFSRISPLELRGRRLGQRRFLSGLPAFDAGLPGTIPFLALLIGSVTFDGLSEASLWTSIAPDLSSFFESLGLSPERAIEATFSVGLLTAWGVVYGFYRLGIAGARSVGGGFTARRLGTAFVHTLVPIALVYAAAHYLTFLIENGQGIAALVSNPLGRDWDLLGTADWGIKVGLIGATAVWYLQVGFVVAGHVGGLTLAHDRAIALYRNAREAVRSQYWMLLIMVVFTMLALWLLAQSNG